MTNPFERPRKVGLHFTQPITGIAMVPPKFDANGGAQYVVLERVEPDIEPEYCTHGKVTCYGCDEWCWLGDETFKIVRAGEAIGVCIECATERFPKDAEPSRTLHDHRRSDGPHT